MNFTLIYTPVFSEFLDSSNLELVPSKIARPIISKTLTLSNVTFSHGCFIFIIDIVGFIVLFSNKQIRLD